MPAATELGLIEHSASKPILNQDLFNGHTRIAVAVSGGSDSLALLFSMHDFARAHGIFLVALTVDHGLRAEARKEAAYVARICAELGIVHQILEPRSPLSDCAGIQRNAREARYQCLLEAARAYGCTLLTTGHTRDDQAETVAMRLARSNGDGFGVSGMSVRTNLSTGSDDLILVRPLLSVSRARLRSHLKRLGQTWVDDPSNDQIKFERVRVRQGLAFDASHAENLLHYAGIVGRFHRDTAKRAADLISETVHLDENARCLLKRETFQVAPLFIQTYALQALLSVVGGTGFMPPAQKVRNLLTVANDATLSRSVINFRKTAITLRRETRDLPHPTLLPCDPIIWDRRFLIRKKDKNFDDVSVINGKAARPLLEGTGRRVPQAAESSPFFLMRHAHQGRVLTAEEVSQICDIKPLLGAFQTFCGEENWPLRDVLKEMFTKSVHGD